MGCEKGCTGSMNDGYFIPLTINDLINGLKGIIKESDALSGIIPMRLNTGLLY